MILCHYWLFYSLIFVTILTRSIETVRINSISRPQSFRYGTLNEVILDCDFTIDDQDELLIVKWFLNDDAQHIYQWIQSPDVRTYSDRIKPYVDEKFVVKDYQTRHRALRLINPPISLSGKYTCSVSSLQNEDNNSTHLVIYEPARSFEMAAIEDDDDENNGFNISCNAYGFYPEPEMKLFKVRSINDTLESEEVKSNTTVTSLRLSTDEFYSITLLSHIEPDLSQTKRSKSHRTYFENEEDIGGEEFMKPSRQRLLSDEQKQRFGKNSERNRQNIAEHYECRVNIPNTDYVEIKRLAIQND
ncbi:hypothetical protein SSS_05728 [Sarcoptes scabiei]|uniref:Ig-like domain-containing protein n=1 Tax=Sarcoptes scabiei TaxID=52283 RepID=A0A834V8M9_SARSC|nr:hypothetical protein SSS_05728 [Sarcoptes scabiei]